MLCFRQVTLKSRFIKVLYLNIPIIPFILSLPERSSGTAIALPLAAAAVLAAVAAFPKC